MNLNQKLLNLHANLHPNRNLNLNLHPNRRMNLNKNENQI